MKKIYLVGNAHLDPVWQWRWQEGSAEAKATVRSALDRMKEFPEFRFVCSSASVYRWVEEFSPEMFEEIKERVKEGRFVVVGGWHVQPDCNLPSGEGFARQSLYSQRYFKEKLGVTAKVGYNVDSFGHNIMLPQILKKSGMSSYVFMRPAPREKDLPTDLFYWCSPDGSSVLTYRILDPYCFKFNSAEELENRISYLEDKQKCDTYIMPLFYGVGNHGGGPTIRNLEVFREYAKRHPDVGLIYSDLSDFFADTKRTVADIPQWKDDLQHHASGCYAAVHKIKNGVRRSEYELSAAEAYNLLSVLLCNKRAESERIAEAWQSVCFTHFHDSMGGCSIREVYDDAELMYGHALNTAAIIENNSLQTISWAIDTSDSSRGLPVVIFNPHGFEVTEAVNINKQCETVRDSDGRVVLSQLVHSSTQECYSRRDTLFRARVPALGYAVYYLDDGKSVEEAEIEKTVFATENGQSLSANRKTAVTLENEYFAVKIETYSGYIVSFYDKREEKELISDRAAVPIVIDEYYHDTWSHGKNFFTDVMARFSDAEVSVLEGGPVRATVKVVSRYNRSILTQYFSLEQGCDRLKVRAFADWHEKHKMLKIAWPMAVEEPEAYYETPFGVIKRPADGEEEPGLTWTAVKGSNGGFALLNDNTYSSSVNGNTIYHTILRSPIYGDHGGPRDSESEFTDQGEIRFSYELMPLRGEGWGNVIRAARQLNKPLTNIVENWHEGKLTEKIYGGINVSKENVILSAIKRSEDGGGMVIRLYECDGKDTEVTVSGALLPTPLNAHFTPYSVNTYYLADSGSGWHEVLLTEYKE